MTLEAVPVAGGSLELQSRCIDGKKCFFCHEVALHITHEHLVYIYLYDVRIYRLAVKGACEGRLCMHSDIQQRYLGCQAE